MADNICSFLTFCAVNGLFSETKASNNISSGSESSRIILTNVLVEKNKDILLYRFDNIWTSSADLWSPDS